MDLQHTAPNPVLGDREASIKTQRQEGRKQTQIPTSIRGRQKDKGDEPVKADSETVGQKTWRVQASQSDQ